MMMTPRLCKLWHIMTSGQLEGLEPLLWHVSDIPP